MNSIDLGVLASLVNQSLSATIAIIAGSTFLYSLSKNVRNRVAWAFSALLLFVTITYIGDLGVSYSGQLGDAERWLRFQWAGIAFVPAGYVHLSHALLELTGTPSRGRRRAFAALTYVLALIFFVMGVVGNLLVEGIAAEPAPHLTAGPIFWLFVLYFASAVLTSLSFVIRARRRSLTHSTRRRMTLLLLPYAAPALSVFPFLIVASPAVLNQPIIFSLVLTLVDVTLVAMLIAMSYVLIFFVSLLPDRLVKAQMLQFLLRGPLVAIVALAVIIWVPRAGRVLGLPGEELMPFLAVAVILLLQWAITVIRPLLERFLIFTGDQVEVRHIQDMEKRLLTGADFKQLLESVLAALCDYLRVPSAFVLSLTGSQPRLEFALGLDDDLPSELIESHQLTEATLVPPGGSQALNSEAAISSTEVFRWNGYWLLPLRHPDEFPSDTPGTLVGVLGIAVRGEVPFQESEMQVVNLLVGRAAEILEDRSVQAEVFSVLESLLPRMEATQRLRGRARYSAVEALTEPAEQVLEHPEFSAYVKDALNHFWGGPKLTDNRLMNLGIVRQALAENGSNPQRALRSVLLQAIESLKPSGQRSLTTTEWLLYNVLEMRFVQGRKVRDVALRMAMSESDLYRKQRVAIEAVGSMISGMERSLHADQHENPDGTRSDQVEQLSYKDDA